MPFWAWNLLSTLGAVDFGTSALTTRFLSALDNLGTLGVLGGFFTQIFDEEIRVTGHGKIQGHRTGRHRRL